MRAAVNRVLASIAFFLALSGAAAIATAAEREAQLGESRWIPSLAITSGVTVQDQDGAMSTYRIQGTNPSVPLVIRDAQFGDDNVISPFVGGSLELLTPALPLPLRPRFFVSGELLPSFGPERVLAQEGDPSRIRGPELNTVLAVEEDNKHYTAGPPGQEGARTLAFEQQDAVGQGSELVSQVDPLMYGAKAGVSFSFEVRGRQLRIKPSAAWLHYRITVRGTVVDPTCVPVTRCTNVYFDQPDNTTPEPGDFPLRFPGFFRETIITESEDGVFDGVGPGLDLEMDAGRFGPIGAAIFASAAAYYIPGDRDVFISNQRSFNDQVGNDVEVGVWRVRVAPWVYRAGLGMRFQWLGSPD